jgi:hypothetical protein
MVHANINRTTYDKIFAILFIVFASCSNSLQAQDFKATIDRLRDGYEKSEKLHIIMKIQAFPDSISTTPFYQETANIKKDGVNYLYQIGNTEMLMNSKYMVVVDRSSREIICNKRDVNAETQFFGKDPIKVNMDSMISVYSVPKYMGRKNNIDHFRVFQKKGAIKQIDMMVNVDENVLQSIAYSYKDGQFVKIAFEVFNKQPEFKADTFNENIYMVFVKGKLKPGPAFQQYNIQEVNN